VAAAHSHTSTSLCELGTVRSQQRRPNARWAAVGEASEASRDVDVAVAHAHAQQHGCLSARWAQTCAPRAEAHDAGKTDEPKVGKRQTTLSKTPSGTFCRRVHPGSEMASQNDQNGCFGQNCPNDPKGLVFYNWRFLGRFKPFLLH